MRYSNLHTHSTYSDGKYSLEENVLSAIEKQMRSIGFSDHSFTSCDTSYCMRREHLEEYLKEIARLKDVYKDDIAIYNGLELDHYSAIPHEAAKTKSLETGVLDDTYVEQNVRLFSDQDLQSLDYLLACVHYIVKNGICYPIDHSKEQQINCMQLAFDGDLFAMAQCYYDLLCELVEQVKPTVVGHFDVLTKFGLMPEEDERYQTIARNALKRIIKTCPYIEINTGAIARGWKTTPYPAPYLWDTLLQENAKIVLGSDSHHKDNLIFAFDETVSRLKQAGFSSFYVFVGSGFEAVPI